MSSSLSSIKIIIAQDQGELFDSEREIEMQQFVFDVYVTQKLIKALRKVLTL